MLDLIGSVLSFTGLVYIGNSFSALQGLWRLDFLEFLGFWGLGL